MKATTAPTPLFIVFEGIDGSGTTTQCTILHRTLQELGHAVVLAREPGGTAAGERIRELVLDPGITDLDDISELLLYAASRRQLTSTVIEPSLRAGKPVISDRYAQSSAAYQGAGRGLGQAIVARANSLATGGLIADITIYLDLPVDEACRRRRSRDVEDRIEGAGRAFQETVRSAYIQLAQQDPESSLLLDGSPPEADLADAIYRELTLRFPEFPYR